MSYAFTLRCYRCGSELDIESVYEEDVEAEAEEEGWYASVAGELDMCPDCMSDPDGWMPW